MTEPIVLTVLVENTVYRRGLLAEHGLAVHIQVGNHGLLFDTGQTDLLLRNAAKLAVRLAATETVVLSHGHDDHSGGLASVLQLAPQAKVFVHPAALRAKFARNPDGTARPIGMRDESARLLRSGGYRLAQSAEPTEVLPGIFLTGQVPRRNAFEDTGGDFFLDDACVQPDPLLDDQALFFESDRGLVVLFGCGHSGVVNTLDYIQQLTDGRPVRAIIGGLHLGRASPNRLNKTVATFRRLDVQQIVPGHCTGLFAISELWSHFPGRCSSCAVGMRLQFER